MSQNVMIPSASPQDRACVLPSRQEIPSGLIEIDSFLSKALRYHVHTSQEWSRVPNVFKIQEMSNGHHCSSTSQDEVSARQLGHALSTGTQPHVIGDQS